MVYFPFRRAVGLIRAVVATSWPRLAADHLNYRNEHRRIYLLHANTLESALGEAVKCKDPVRHASRCASINPRRESAGGGGGDGSCFLTSARASGGAESPPVCPCDRPALLDLFANISISRKRTAQPRSRIYLLAR